MDDLLSNYVNSLSENTQKIAETILSDARIAETNVGVLADRLANSVGFKTLFLDPTEYYSKTSGTKTSANVRSVALALDEMYSRSNAISDLIGSMSSLLLSELASVEKELELAEKSISNYAFMLSDASAYSYAFMDGFSDTNNLEYPKFSPSDRSGRAFAPHEYAHVDVKNGILNISDGIHKTFAIKPHVALVNFHSPINSRGLTDGGMKGVYQGIVGIDNSTSDDHSISWRAECETRSPINAPLPEFTALYNESYSGALIAVDYTLESQTNCDIINIEPIANSSFEVLQVLIYKSEKDAKPEKLLTKPRSVVGNCVIKFPMKPVAKFRVFYRQPTYERIFKTISPPSRKNNQIHLDRVFKNIDTRRALLPSIFDKAFGTMLGDDKKKLAAPISRTLDGVNSQIELSSLLTANRTLSQLNRTPRVLEAAIANLSNASNPFLFGHNRIFQQVDRLVDDAQFIEKSASRIPTDKNLRSINSDDKTSRNLYHYSFVINNISIGRKQTNDRGVLISKPFDSTGDIGEIRVKVSDFNPKDDTVDDEFLTSVEYSVSISPTPKTESDWIPILPVGTSSVLSERLFLNSNGYGFFRFPAARVGSIIVYKNRMQFDLDRVGTFIHNASGNTIGIQINQASYTAKDIFTVFYTPFGDQTVVNFESRGFGTPSLVSSYDAGGPGEGFESSGGQRLISLSHQPFIDSEQVKASTYSDTLGLIGYTPITIRFSDGSVATNLSTYDSQTQPGALDPDSDGITYINTKNGILFNRVVTSPFRVFYQYLPNNARLRIVLRSNTGTVASPYVDYYQIKSKVRQANNSVGL